MLCQYVPPPHSATLSTHALHHSENKKNSSILNSNCNELILTRSASTQIYVSPSTDTPWTIDIPLVSGYTVLGYIYLGSSYSSQVVIRPEGMTSDKCYGYARSITNSISVFTISAVFLYAKSYKM